MGGAEKNLVDVVLNLNPEEFTPYVLALKGGELHQQACHGRLKVEVNNLQTLLSLDALKKGRALYRFLKKTKN